MPGSRGGSSRGGVGAVLASVVLLGACSGSGSDGGGGSGDGADRSPRRTDVVRGVERLHVVAGDGAAWAFLDDVVWEVGDDGQLAERPELSALGGFVPVRVDGGRLAVAEARCAGTDVDVDEAGPDECPEWDNVLRLYDDTGSLVRTVDLGRSDAVYSDGVGALGPRVVGASGEQVWLQVPSGDLVSVTASGEVDTLPPPLAGGTGELCVIDDRLLAVETGGDGQHTVVRIHELADTGWRPVAGAERSFAGYVEGCGPWGFVQVNHDSAHPAARWAPETGWVPTGPSRAPPPGSVGVGSGLPDLHVWGGGGEILRRRTDGGFDRTGVVLVDPDGGDDVPAETRVDEQDGTVAACARFRVDGPPPLPMAASRATPATTPGPGEAPVVCDLSPR